MTKKRKKRATLAAMLKDLIPHVTCTGLLPYEGQNEWLSAPVMVVCNGSQKPGQKSQFILRPSSTFIQPLWRIYLRSR